MVQRFKFLSIRRLIPKTRGLWFRASVCGVELETVGLSPAPGMSSGPNKAETFGFPPIFQTLSILWV